MSVRTFDEVKEELAEVIHANHFPLARPGTPEYTASAYAALSWLAVMGWPRFSYDAELNEIVADGGGWDE